MIRWYNSCYVLTHWGRVTHICVDKLAIIGSDNGLSPGRRQAIIWTNAGILLIGPLGTNFSEILIEMQIFSFRKMHWKMSSAKWRSFCLGLNVLKLCYNTVQYNNPCHAQLILRNIKIHLYLPYFLKLEMEQVAEILPSGRQGSVHPLQPIPWL